MKTTSVIFTVGIALLCGCATPPPSSSGTTAVAADPSDKWIKGTLTCLEDGTVLSFRIQKKMALGGSAAGGVVAINSATKSRFTGQYTGLMQSDFTMANAVGTLNDQQGTVIQLRMQIRAGWSPHGIGEGIDNHGNHYQIQF